jgi:hypothetical protein
VDQIAGGGSGHVAHQPANRWIRRTLISDHQIGSRLLSRGSNNLRIVANSLEPSSLLLAGRRRAPRLSLTPPASPSPSPLLFPSRFMPPTLDQARESSDRIPSLTPALAALDRDTALERQHQPPCLAVGTVLRYALLTSWGRSSMCSTCLLKCLWEMEVGLA